LRRISRTPFVPVTLIMIFQVVLGNFLLDTILGLDYNST
jgi:hypothetical protein